MTQACIQDKKVLLQRGDLEKKRFVHALNRIEGQVRGVRVMIERDRYCGDELQQIRAAVASLARVSRLLANEHVLAAARLLAEGASTDVVAAGIALVVKHAM